MTFHHLLTPAVLAILITSFATQVSAVELSAPVYEAESCCKLCPEVQDISRYNTSFLKNSRMLVQGKGDWLFRTLLDLRTDFDYVDAGRPYLKKLREAFARRGIELVVVYQPTRGLVHRDKLTPEASASFNFDLALANYRTALKRFEQIGFHAPDLSRLVDEHEEHAFYFRADPHWTPYGAQRTAKVVAETIRSLPVFADIPRRAFTSKIVGRNSQGNKGVLGLAAAQLCGNSGNSIEYVDRFVTEPEEVRNEDLFSDIGIPNIVLVGTSHSGAVYNFPGFLLEYLDTDILIFAYPEGGLEGGMIEYLGSEEFQNSPPKILIWEFSANYRLDQDSIYRQLFALLDDGCEGKQIEISSKARLGSGKQMVLVNSDAKMLANRDARIDIRFTDAEVKTLRADFLYMNGSREVLRLDKTNRVATNGRFVFDMRAEGNWSDMVLLGVELEGTEEDGTPQELEVRVCRRTAAKPE
ncbi:alginate biosynthesis protein AlgX [Betaproteobacteria bacterium]|nr:alginate biosynthesis protein AlgX [Betaproteobacteria bacterium]GHU03278.1 alginate biosynthesis protein AlgX [Betaproteobacteria bacterium]GHU21785.1 alginate biosynthesis protein AlgX [Betaproteobacteria bacterium]